MLIILWIILPLYKITNTTIPSIKKVMFAAELKDLIILKGNFTLIKWIKRSERSMS